MPSDPHPGLYAHVPFCSRKCPYCDFYSVSALGEIGAFLEALAAEAKIVSRYWSGEFDSLYLGGGSPSLLSIEDLAALKKALSPLKISPKAEVTLEANPEDVTSEKARAWSDWGVTRVSLGVQSFSQEALVRALGRTHNHRHNHQAIAAIKKEGLALSLDLLFGWSGETLAEWEADLREALKAGPRHISAYALTPSPGTRLAEELATGARPPLPIDDAVADLFLLAGEILAGGGFTRYEVSNFAKRGQECRHNLKYWRRAPYLGLGPAAHSFDGVRRYANVASLDDWAQALSEGRTQRDFIEDIAPEQARLECLMLGLRLSEGFPPAMVKSADALDHLIGEGYLRYDGERVAPSEKGFLAADYLARTLC
ncbi:MAG: radical SAM family heme chaperone HemW [Deltaproteobacteria bacterium]|jgi:oxygen-independent coproporphyrinogen-3 oxidase|nr:radical SAM family heme chaperone HemW [Deltaproteobacteria bacterium]